MKKKIDREKAWLKRQIMKQMKTLNHYIQSEIEMLEYADYEPTTVFESQCHLVIGYINQFKALVNLDKRKDENLELENVIVNQEQKLED